MIKEGKLNQIRPETEPGLIPLYAIQEKKVLET